MYIYIYNMVNLSGVVFVKPMYIHAVKKVNPPVTS